MKLEMGRPHLVRCDARTTGLFEVLPEALGVVHPEGFSEARGHPALILATPDQDAFLDGMDSFSEGLVRAGVSIKDPLGLVALPEHLLERVVGHAERLIRIEGRERVLCAVAEGQRLAVFSIRPADPSRIGTVEGPGLSAGSGPAVDRLLAFWRDVDAEWAWQDIVGDLRDPSRVRAFVRHGDALVMPESRSASVTHVGVQTGPARTLDEVGDGILDADSKSLLSALGVEVFHKASDSLAGLCLKAVGHALRDFDEPRRIGRVILSSHTFVDATEQLKTLAGEFRRMGVEAPVELVYMTRCASAVTAMRVALGNILSGIDSDVLVVLVDRVFDEQKGRTLNRGMSLFSDGACAFVVSADKPGLRIRGLSEVTDHSMFGLKPNDDFVSYLKSFGTGLRKPVESLVKALPDVGFTRVVTGNYNTSIMRNYCVIAGFSPRLIYTGQLSRHAHLFSSDLILNIASLAASEELRPGESAVLIGTGSYHWGAIALTLEEMPRFDAEGWGNLAVEAA